MATAEDAREMWLRHPKTGVIVLVVHAETQQRCLSDGFTLAADPRLPVVVAPASSPDPVAAGTDAPVSAPAADLSDLTAIADSPSELATALETAEIRAAAEAAQVQAVRERNTAARAAFGLATPTPSAPAPAPAPTPTRQSRGKDR